MEKERDNIWAPWRIGYIISAIKETKGCFLCEHIASPRDDEENFVLWRSKHSIVVFNHYPYNNGHTLVVPLRHIADLSEATDEEMLDLMRLTREFQKCLTLTVQAQGFNVGINIGRCAGAGLPGHLHIHIVPRWNGDTNFMSTCAQTEVISQSMRELYDLLKKTSEEHSLPKL